MPTTAASTIRTATTDAGRPPRVRGLLPGLAVATAIAVVSTAVGRAVPVVGAPVVAVVLGATLRAVVGDRAALRAGATFAGRYVLQAAVVAFGASLSAATVVTVGLGSLPVMLGTLALCLASAAVLGRLLKVERDLRTLIGAGTGICGVSAVGAMAPAIAARETAVAYAVSTIVVYNVAAALLFPPLGQLMELDAAAFGLWAGTAVNDTSSVAAAATAYGPGAVDHAIVVKLTRALMIVPVVAGFGWWRTRGQRRTRGNGESRALVRLVPPFLALFLLATLASSAGLVPPVAQPAFGTAAQFGITVALAGVGLSLQFAALRRTGMRPLLLGGLLWLVVSAASLALQAATGHL